MKVSHIEHLGIAVKSLDESIPYWENVLGLKCYAIEEVADQKVKKSADEMSIQLVKNPDIVATVAAHTPHPYTVGFAAETQDVEHYARGKLARKNLDMIVANDVSRSDIGFNSDNNAVNVYWPEGQCQFDVMNKQILARELIGLVANHFRPDSSQ